MKTIKPTFFIVGTPKSGTTSLFKYLEEHPQVFVPSIKEPHFFAFPEVKNTYYKTKIINNKPDYLKLYKQAKSFKAAGDFSTSYLKNSKTAQRIYDFNPQAKIIIVLRNPVERAISHYLMDYNLGYVKAPLKEIITYPKKHALFYNQYISLGEYEAQIQKYTQVFPKEQILIFSSNQFFNNTQKVLQNVFQFLEIKEDISINLGQKHNQYNVPKYSFVQKLTQSSTLIKLKNLVPEFVLQPLKSVLVDNNKPKPEFVEEKEFLTAYYASQKDYRDFVTLKTEN